MHVQERLEYVFSVAENEFKVYHLLEPSGKHSFSALNTMSTIFNQTTFIHAEKATI